MSIRRPLNFEVIHYTEPWLYVDIESLPSGKVPFKIMNSTGAILQSGTFDTGTAGYHSAVALNASVMNHRGSFLKLVIGQSEVSFGVGLSFLVAGQSNTVNSGCRECTSTRPTNQMVVTLLDSQVDPNIQFKAGFSDILFPQNITARIRTDQMQFIPLSESPAHVHGQSKNVWKAVGDSLSAELQVPVSFTIIGVGGTSMAQWNSSLYSQFQYGSNMNLTGVLWHQGESDAMNLTQSSTYTGGLEQLIDRSRLLMGRDVPWVVAQASQCLVQEPGASNTEVLIGAKDKNMIEIELAQINFYLNKKNTKGLYLGPNTNQLLHRCHFDIQPQFDQHVQAWISKIKQNGVFQRTVNTATETIPQSYRRGLEPVYRFFKSGDHFFTLSQAEGSGNGFAAEGVGFTVFAAAASQRGSNYKTLYRCADASLNQHFVSDKPTCDGKTIEGVFGEIYTEKPAVNILPAVNQDIYLAMPLYSCKGASAYLTTPQRSECENAYFDQGAIRILGWIPYEL